MIEEIERKEEPQKEEPPPETPKEETPKEESPKEELPKPQLGPKPHGYRQFTKLMFDQMKDQKMPSREKFKLIGKMWQEQKAK